MSLTAPLALGLVLLAAPLVWAYLARRRAPRRTVGSVMILRAAIAEARTRVVAPRLRHPLSMALALLALILLAVGLAGPRCGPTGGGDVIVVLDTSASMGRTTEEGRRIAVAVEALTPHLEALGPGERVALVEAGPVPRVRAGLSADAAPVLEAARALDASTAGEADVAAAVRLADALCEDPAEDVVLLVSDVATVPEGARCPVRRIAVPVGPADMGIAALVARRADGLGLTELVLAVHSDHDEPRAVEVALRVDGRLVDTAALDVPAGGTAWSTRHLEAPAGLVEARLVGQRDADPRNDVAVAVRPAAPPVRVGLVTDTPGGFLATALALHPGVELSAVAPDQADTLDGVDLLVLEAVPDTVPASARALAFGPGPARSLGLDVGEPVEAPRVTRWSFDDPLLRFVDLDGLVVQRAASVTPPGDGASLLEVDGAPVLVTGTSASRPLVAAGFAPEDTDLVLRVGFLHLVANVVEWAAPAEADPPVAHPGRVWAGARADDVFVGTEGQTRAGWAPLPGGGPWTVRDASGVVRGQVAPVPSGPSEWASSGVAGAVAGLPAGGAGGWPWWMWAVAAAIGALVLETLLGAALGWWGRLVRGPA